MFSKYNPILTMDYLVNEEEGLKFERKEGKVVPKDLAKLLIAFANTEGGTVIVGQRNNKSLEGLKEYDQNKIEKLIDVGAEFCSPMIPIDKEKIKITNDRGEEDFIYMIHIESSDKLHKRSDGKVFRRVGDSSIEAKDDILRHLEYEKGSIKYEEEIVPDLEITDLDSNIFTVFKEEQIRNNNEYTKSFEEFLINTHLATKRKDQLLIKRSAALTFSPNDFSILSQSSIRIIKVDGKEMRSVNTSKISEIEAVNGSLYYQVNQTMDTLKKVLKSSNTIEKNGIFEVRYEYPLEAIRESLINAVTHRSYDLDGIEIMVIIYVDRIEIKSPGRLPGHMNENNIMTDRFSRNKNVSKIMAFLGVVRKLGEGIDRIIESMEEQDLPKPLFVNGEANFSVILRNEYVKNEALDFMKKYGEEFKDSKKVRRQEIMEEAKELICNFYTLDNKKWNELSPDEKMILVYAVTEKKIYRKNIEVLIKKAGTTTNDILKNMNEKNILRKSSVDVKDKSFHYLK
jgi:ATP-dependent DNA helicase RecG